MITISWLPRETIVEFLRSVLVDPRSRAETSNSDTFTGDASEKTFTLTPTSGKTVSAVTAVTISSTAQNKNEDFTVDLQNQQVTFTSAPAAVADNIVVTYKEGSKNWIYPDQPKVSLGAVSYPRISVTKINVSHERLGNFNADMWGTGQYQIDVWAREKDVFTIGSLNYNGEALTSYFITKINLVFKDNIDDLYNRLSNYEVISERNAVWERDREVFHAIMDIQLSGKNIGE